MGLSNESIIAPEEPKPGIPLKKSTLAVLAVGVLSLGVASSMFLGGGSSQPADLSVKPTEAPVGQVVGKPQSIDEEIAAVAGEPRVVPESVRRPDNTASLYEKPMASLENERVSPVVAPAQPDQQALLDAEREAEVRLAKAMVVDFDERNGEAKGPLAMTPAGMVVGAAQQMSGGQLPMEAAAEAEYPGIAKAIQRLQEEKGGSIQSTSWMKEYAGEVGGRTRGGKVLQSYQAPSDLVLMQGKVIPAVLGRAINSDLPGRISAYTTVDIYDSLGKGQLLIPKGSVLDGKYDSNVKVGQARILFAFERLILPDGTSFDMPPAPGSDLRGAAGISGEVNNHFLKMFASSFFIAVLADKTSAPTGVTTIGNESGGIKGAAGEILVDVSKSILDRNKVIPPTITVRQGERINVEVVSDMVFPRAHNRRK
ncbi:TrbI/VirB10 family protein [Hydrogenophaga sp. BPS33]|uniref:TrbI/VirB10 family protein n=1 Tax=Hydrogenophaga sp. BPS33 TaxID=2651974 RepID=UPI001320281C|nr:TrbI/VirB10 family protein [Hydrogenophaga sp. BPS33]QHE89343.1 TrbI/VirB10 family protein [Hydrogenophaga sp. BPS33]